jgi:hypothetical protein
LDRATGASPSGSACRPALSAGAAPVPRPSAGPDRLGTQLALLLDASLGRLEPAGGWRSPLHAALGALGVAAAAFQRRWVGAPADRWEALSAVTSGLLLANATRPYPPVW